MAAKKKGRDLLRLPVQHREQHLRAHVAPAPAREFLQHRARLAVLVPSPASLVLAR